MGGSDPETFTSATAWLAALDMAHVSNAVAGIVSVGVLIAYTHGLFRIFRRWINESTR